MFHFLQPERPRGEAERDTGTLRTGRRAHRFTGARTNTTRGCAGRGGLQRWPDALGGLGHASRPSELAPIGAGCCRADCHSHADSTPCRVFPSPYGRLLTRKGVRPHFKGLSPSTSHTTPLRTLTSTQENGSRCAAQRAGGRLAVYRRKETAERVPLASTCVASCSPVVQLPLSAPD